MLWWLGQSRGVCPISGYKRLRGLERDGLGTLRGVDVPSNILNFGATILLYLGNLAAMMANNEEKTCTFFLQEKVGVLKEMVQKRGNYISTQDHAKIQFDFFIFRNVTERLFLKQEKF